MESFEVSVKIKTVQYASGQREIISEEYPGIIELNADQKIVKYKTSDDKGDCKYEIIMTPNGCAAVTTGAVERLIKYEIGQKYDCSMKIFAGVIPMECETSEYVYDDRWDKSGRVRARIHYDLYSGNELLSHNVLNIIIKKIK